MTTAPDLMQRLKSETKEAHQSIERALNLMSPDVSVADYTRYLEAMAAFHLKLEDVYKKFAEASEEYDLNLPEKIKTRSLRKDLEELRRKVRAQDVPDGVLPPVKDFPSLLGILYVLEGSMFGAKVISKHLAACFELKGIRLSFHYLNHYGAQMGAMWKSFSDAVNRYSAGHPEDDQLVIASANRTFRKLESLLAGVDD